MSLASDCRTFASLCHPEPYGHPERSEGSGPLGIATTSGEAVVVPQRPRFLASLGMTQWALGMTSALAAAFLPFANHADRSRKATEPTMTAPTPDPHPNPEPFPQPTPKPASPDETPVTIVDLPPNQPSPGVPVDKPLPS